MDEVFGQELQNALRRHTESENVVLEPSSLLEIAIDYYVSSDRSKVKLDKIPSNLRAIVNTRRHTKELCKLFDPFISTPPLEYDVNSALRFVDDSEAEKRYRVKLHFFGLNLFNVKDVFYDDAAIKDIETNMMKDIIYTYIYYKYHLVELSFGDEYALRPRKRDPDFNIAHIDIENYLFLCSPLASLMTKLE